MEKLSTRLWTIAMLMIATLTVASCSSEDEEIPKGVTVFTAKIDQARKEGYLTRNNALVNGKKKAVANVEKIPIEDAPEEIISELDKKNLFGVGSKEKTGIYMRIYLEKEFNDRNYFDIVFREKEYYFDYCKQGYILELDRDGSKVYYWGNCNCWFVGYTDKDAGIDKWWPTNLREAVYSIMRSYIDLVVPYVSDGKDCMLTLDCDYTIPWK